MAKGVLARRAHSSRERTGWCNIPLFVFGAFGVTNLLWSSIFQLLPFTFAFTCGLLDTRATLGLFAFTRILHNSIPSASCIEHGGDSSNHLLAITKKAQQPRLRKEARFSISSAHGQLVSLTRYYVFLALLALFGVVSFCHLSEQHHLSGHSCKITAAIPLNGLDLDLLLQRTLYRR